MRTAVFDIETNGLLDEATAIHCLCIADADGDGEVERYHGSPGIGPRDGTFAQGMARLNEFDRVVAHNAIGFDVPAMRKLLGWSPKGAVEDTLVLTKLFWSDLYEIDVRRKYEGFPTQYWGRHSLEAWGHRLDEHKGGYTGGWDHFSLEMLDYCAQDVAVLRKLWQTCARRRAEKGVELSVEVEHKFATAINRINMRGVAFDEEGATALLRTLEIREAEVKDELARVCDDFVDHNLVPPAAMGKYPLLALRQAGWEPEEFTPSGTPRLNAKVLAELATTDGKVGRVAQSILDNRAGTSDLASLSKLAGPVTEEVVTEFNPSSRQHIARHLRERRGWSPSEFTESGQVKVDETTLKGLEWEEAKLANEALLLDKRLGQLSRGRNGWMKLVKHGQIKPYINHCGTITFRCSHSKPNLGQVPAVRSAYGPECRALFGPRPGFRLIGCDAQGIELRILSHYLAPYDGGRFARILDDPDGDPHTHNQQIAGLATRDQAKTAIYACLYGAGYEKLGKSLGVSQNRARTIKKKLLGGLGVDRLIEALKETARERGFLRGLDGRRIPVRSLHAVLNTLIQANASVLLKAWTNNVDAVLRTFGAFMVLHVHDEVQVECPSATAEACAAAIEEACAEAGRQLGLRVTTPAEAKIGANWAETH